MTSGVRLRSSCYARARRPCLCVQFCWLLRTERDTCGARATAVQAAFALRCRNKSTPECLELNKDIICVEQID